VSLNVTVGGEAVVKISWGSSRVEDAQKGQPVHAFANATNGGNVRATAQLQGQVLAFDHDQVLATGNGSLALDPGESREVPVDLSADLAPGQYRVHLTSAGLDATLPFKVVAAGTVAPDGFLHALLHVPRATAGHPVRIDAWFTNTGTAPIQSARLKLEVRQGTTLLAPLESDSLAVQPGASVNLTAYWTPSDAGTYTLSGQELYDGFLTPVNESLLNVEGGGTSVWLWVGLAVLAAAAAALAYVRATQGERLGHLTRLSRLIAADCLTLDETAMTTLELLTGSEGSRDGLFATVNETMTPMGARLLRQWLLQPLRKAARIAERQDVRGKLVEAPETRARLRALLRGVGVQHERRLDLASSGLRHFLIGGAGHHSGRVDVAGQRGERCRQRPQVLEPGRQPVRGPPVRVQGHAGSTSSIAAGGAAPASASTACTTSAAETAARQGWPATGQTRARQPAQAMSCHPSSTCGTCQLGTA